jgi:pilus assembly protein TadC
MGRHEEPVPGRADGTFWGTARWLVRQPVPFLVMLLAILVGLGVLAVVLQNAYGGFWGALVSAGLGPFVVSILLRSRMRRRRGSSARCR